MNRHGSRSRPATYSLFRSPGTRDEPAFLAISGMISLVPGPKRACEFDSVPLAGARSMSSILDTGALPPPPPQPRVSAQGVCKMQANCRAVSTFRNASHGSGGHRDYANRTGPGACASLNIFGEQIGGNCPRGTSLIRCDERS